MICGAACRSHVDLFVEHVDQQGRQVLGAAAAAVVGLALLEMGVERQPAGTHLAIALAALADTMIPPWASVLNRFRIVLRHRDEGAGGGAAITAAPLEQRYTAGIDRGRQPYDAEARLLLRHCLGQDRR